MYATEAQAALLRAAVAEIKKHPETFDMDTWGNAEPQCGTVCCLAGQIVWNAIGDTEAFRRYLNDDIAEPVSKRAADVLGFEWSDDWMVGPMGALFLWPSWPVQFRPAGSPTPEQLEARVEWWIEHGE